MPPKTRRAGNLNNTTPGAGARQEDAHVTGRIPYSKDDSFDTVTFTGDDRCRRCQESDLPICEVLLKKTTTKMGRDKRSSCKKCQGRGVCSFVNATIVGAGYGKAAVDGLEEVGRMVEDARMLSGGMKEADQEEEVTRERVLAIFSKGSSQSDSDDGCAEEPMAASDLDANDSLDTSPEAIDADLAAAAEHLRLSYVALQMSGFLAPHLHGETKEQRIERQVLAGELEPCLNATPPKSNAKRSKG